MNKAVCVSGRPGSIQVMPQVVNSRKPMTGTYRKLVYGRVHVSIKIARGRAFVAVVNFSNSGSRTRLVLGQSDYNVRADEVYL